MEVVLFLAGLLVGVGITLFTRKKPKPSGTFVMDFSDPLKDICRLELSEDLNSIYEKKQIMLTIRTIENETQN